MKGKDKTKAQLIKELKRLRQQLAQNKTSGIQCKHIIAKLKESEEKLKTIMETVNDVIFQLSPSGIIKYVSPNVKKFYGYDPEELIGKHLKETTPKEDVPVVLGALKRILSEKKVRHFTINQLDSKGKTIDTEISLSPVKKRGKIIAVQGVMRDITERKRVKENLWKSEKRLSDIADNSLTWIWEINTKGKYMYASPAVEKILGYKPVEMLKKHFYDFFHPQDKSILKKAAFKVIAKKQPFREFVNKNVHKNGKMVWFLTSGVPILDGKGKLLGYRGADVDITERKQAAEALRESEERYRSVVENSQAGILVVDEAYRFVYVNKKLSQILGYSREEIIGQDFRKFLDAKSKRLVGDRYIRRQRGEKVPSQYEFNVVRKDGEIRHVEISSTVIRNLAGDKRTVAQILDITERKQAEEALHKSEKDWRNSFSSLDDIMFIIDKDYNIENINDSGLKFLGKSKEQVIGEKCYKVMHNAEYPTDNCPFRKSLKTKKVASIDRYEEKFGRYLSIKTSPILDENGEVVKVVDLISDITERKQAEEHLKESEEKYRDIVGLAPDGIITVDIKGIITSCNTAFYNMTGYSEDEIIGKHFSKLPSMRLEDIPRYMKWFKTLVKNKRLPSFEFMWVREDGVIHYAEIHSSYMKKDGKTVGYQAIVRDVTERKQAAEALRESEEKYKTLTENINVGIYRNTVGPKGKFIEVNPAIIKMFGYKNKEEFFRTDVADLYQNFKGREKFNKKMLMYGFVKDEELQLKKKNGTLFICSVSAVAVRDTKGEVIYYDGIIEDITERKQAERKLMSGYKRLQKTLRGTVDTLALAAAKRDPYTADHQHRVALLVCAIAKELGFSADQIEGLRLAAIIHDVGKIHVPAEILNKPSALTEFEFNFIRTHPQVGYDILWKVDFPWPIAKIVLQHHERLNGSGYPQGLKGKDLILEARILAVADVVEAMTAHRPYRPAHSLKKTLEEIHKNRGILYEPRVVDICLNLFRKKHFKFKGNDNSE